MRLSQHIVRNVLTSYLGYVTLLISLLVFPFVVRTVGDEVFGIWVLTWATVGYLDLFDFGIGHSVARFIAERHSQGDHEGMSRVASVSLLLYAFAGMFALVVVFVLSRGFPHWFGVRPEHASLASSLALLAGIRVSLSLPGRVFGGILTGVQRLDLCTYVSVSGAIVTAVLTVVVLRAGLDMVAVGVVTLAVGTAGDCVSYFLVRKLLPELRLSARHCNRSTVREITGFGSRVFINRVAVQVSYRTDAIVIGLFLPKAQVTVYQIGLRLAELVREFPTKIPAAIFPAVSHLSASEEPERLRNIILRGTRYAMILLAPLAIFCALEGERLIHCWMGSTDYAESALVLRVLLIAAAAAVAQNVLAVAMQAVGQPSLPMWVGIFDAGANLTLSLLLVRSYGIVGVALATAIPIAISNLLIFVPLAARRLAVPLRRLVPEALVCPFLIAGVYGVPLMLLAQHLLPPSWWAMALELCSFAAGYVALTAVFRNARERREDASLIATARAGRREPT